MKRRTVVAVVALTLTVAGCSGGRAARKAVATEAHHRVRTTSRLEVERSSSLPGQPGGFALDRQGAVVEVDDEKVVAFDTRGEQRWSTSVVGAALGWPWLGHGVVVVPTLSAHDLVRDDAGPGGCVTIDRATGARRWSYEEEGRSGVAVAGLGDRAYCVFGDGTMAAIDIATGELAWRAQLVPDAPPGAIEVSERTALVVDPHSQRLVFTAHYDSRWVVVQRGLARGEDRGVVNVAGVLPPSAPVLVGPGRVAFAAVGRVGVWDLSPKSLSVVDFRAPEGFDPASVPVATNGLVIVAARDGSVSAVDTVRRKVRWTTQLGTPFLDARPAVAGGVVLVADGTRTPWALRLSDGSKIEVPAAEGFVIATAADPDGGFAVAERGDWNGRIRRWLPTG